MEQITKKKKKKSSTLLLTDFECLSETEIISSISDMRKKIKSIFKNHIGQENAISPFHLFYLVYNIDPSTMDFSARYYWWVILKNVLKSLRRDDVLFVINNGHKLYVLKTQEELSKFNDKMNRDVKRIRELKKKATRWVQKKSWRNI
jgi:hypothetical protein